MRDVGALMQLLFTLLLPLPLELPPMTMYHCSCYAQIVRMVCPKVTVGDKKYQIEPFNPTVSSFRIALGCRRICRCNDKGPGTADGSLCKRKECL